VMDPAYLSAFAALAGSTIGGLTSLTASWLTQYVQVRAQQRAHDVSRREQLYATFIDEASRLYTEAYVMCQHFSGQKTHGFLRSAHRPAERGSHSPNDTAGGCRTPQYIQTPPSGLARVCQNPPDKSIRSLRYERSSPPPRCPSSCPSGSYSVVSRAGSGVADSYRRHTDCHG